MELLMEFMGKGLVIMLAIALPCVLTAAGIGLVVGILQAVTQVQEQTIAAAPKITAVFLVIIVLGAGYVKMLTNLFQEAIQISFNVIPKRDNYVLSADYVKYVKPFSDEMKDDVIKTPTSAKEMIEGAGSPPFTKDSDRMKYYSAPRMPVPSPDLMERKKINEKKK